MIVIRKSMHVSMRMK